MIKMSLILGLLLACTPVVHADETPAAPASSDRRRAERYAAHRLPPSPSWSPPTS